MTGSNGSAVATRDDIRARILGSGVARAKTKTIELFGMQVDVRQPSVGDMLDARQIEDVKSRSVEFIIKYVCVVGTTERVFEEGDAEDILAWPFGDDMVRLQEAIMSLTGVNISDGGKGVDITEEIAGVKGDPLSAST